MNQVDLLKYFDNLGKRFSVAVAIETKFTRKF